MSDTPTSEATEADESGTQDNWTIKAPDPQYSGLAGSVEFTDGVAVTDRGELAEWFGRNGYTVTKGGTEAPAKALASVVPSTTGIGGQSLDAAVVGKAAEGPHSDAFLPPVGAGEGKDPHGAEVVSPGLHAVGPAPLVPGEVSRQPEAQEAKESEAAQAVLIDGEPVTEYESTQPDFLGGDDEALPVGPLNQSDPASEGKGPDAAPAPERPAGNATKDQWVEYAVGQGLARDEAETLSRGGIIERFPEEG